MDLGLSQCNTWYDPLFHLLHPALLRPQRGHVPVVVGGTGLYLRWLMKGKAGTQRASPEVVQYVRRQVVAAWRTAVAPELKTSAPASLPRELPAGDPSSEALESGGEVAQGELPPLPEVHTPGLSKEQRWDIACGLLGRWGDPHAMQR